MLDRRTLICDVAERCGVTQREAERVLRTAGDLITAEVAQGGEVRFFQLGTFRAVERKPRVARNPQTGERVDVPARKAVKFVPSAEFKRATAQGCVEQVLQSQAG